ncbi:ABC transporter substrate-binding protein [Ruegeria sp. R13_0]|uniref:ABC transporter substrate-binding protein n=1 Tax=Ruegeria sp. R13_0 TaxID=2821099 RepID=UPI001ADAD16B|nr:ABC transporter substrate-binding protein [Ruegeria sp. R13_0]MBO9434859.1 ABC transporter substrate-binding protein [Ruegeria sp. R13_0]
MKMKLLAASAAVALGVAGSAQADCGEISITEMDWGSAIIVTQVSKFLLEQGYGCSVTIVPSATTPALASVAETGEPDILTELWTNGAPAYPGLIESGAIIERAKVLSDGGVEAWWIPTYLAEAHPELTTMEGILANPDLVGGRFHNCPVGWTCQRVSSNMAKAAGLADAGIEDFIHGSGETLAASIASAYDSKEPWFGYYWAPTSILGRYPMVQVDVGPHVPEAHECNSQEECAEPVLGAFPSSDVTTVVTNTFAESHPEETALMENVQFTNEVMNGLLAWQEENNASGEEAAVYFLTNFQDTWSEWLNDDARGKLSALLK